MAKKILIDGVIGSRIRSDNIRDSLKGLKGEDLFLEISSPGGYILSGLQIFDLLSKYKRKYPKADITAHVIGFAASMATVIAMVAKKIEVSSRSVWMVHNAIGWGGGDYNIFFKYGNLLKKHSENIANIYAANSKINKDKKYYEDLMNKETWLFGKEIVEAGFANSVWNEKDKNIKKEDAIKKAKEEREEKINNLYKEKINNEDLDKLAAMLPDNIGMIGGTIDNIEKPKIEEKMDKTQENKITQKDVDEAYAKGLADGKKEMRELTAKATKFFGTEYPDAIKNIAIKVLNGEENISALTGAAAAFDCMKEALKSKDAKDEGAPDVNASQLHKPVNSANNGVCNTEEDFQAEVARMKAMGGTE